MSDENSEDRILRNISETRRNELEKIVDEGFAKASEKRKEEASSPEEFRKLFDADKKGAIDPDKQAKMADIYGDRVIPSNVPTEENYDPRVPGQTVVVVDAGDRHHAERLRHVGRISTGSNGLPVIVTSDAEAAMFQRRLDEAMSQPSERMTEVLGLDKTVGVPFKLVEGDADGLDLKAMAEASVPTPELKSLIRDAQASGLVGGLSPTARPVAEGIERILRRHNAGHAFDVLDHGFVKVVDYMGDDAAIVQAARVSYGKGTKKRHEDEGLIHYLMRHHHTTPFEMCELKLHLKMPIFVARQWIRHRMASINEISGRYSQLDREFYVPAPDQLAAQSKTNGQGRGDVLEGDEAARVLNLLKAIGISGFNDYEVMLQGADVSDKGLARELARIGLPLSTYTQFYWKIDLHNLLSFVRLRADPHAQYEIRAYADVLLSILREWVPMATGAFEEHRMYSATFSRRAMDYIRARLDGHTMTRVQVGMTIREWREIHQTLNLECTDDA